MSFFLLCVYHTCLGFLSGLPLILLTDTMQAWHASLGNSAAFVSGLTYLTIPYTIKPVFASLIDEARKQQWLNYTNIQDITACGLVLCLCGLSVIHPSQMLKTQLFLVLCACLLSACYDTVVDGNRISSVPPQNQGYITSLFIAGYRVSWLFAGGLGLMFADHFGWSSLYLMMACLYGVIFVFTVIMRTNIQTLPEQSTPTKTNQPNTFKHCLQWLQTPSVICAISIALMVNCHMAIIKPVITVFLLNGLKMGLSEIGIWYKSFGFVATLAGGFFTSRYLRTTIDSSAIHVCMASQIICGLCFFLTSVYTGEHWLSVLCIISECFSIGISSTVMVIVLAQSCQTSLAGTQYALLTSFCALERLFVVPLTGSIPDYYGWPQFWLTTLGITSMAWLGSFMTQLVYRNRTFSEANSGVITTTQA